MTIYVRSIPRTLYYKRTAGVMGEYQGLKAGLLGQLDRNAYDVLFDDFSNLASNAQLEARWTTKEDTGASTQALGNAILASTASDNKYAGICGGTLSWFPGQGALFEARVKIASAAVTETKFEMGWCGTAAGDAGVINNIDTPSFTAAVNSAVFSYDADGTNKCWQACSYHQTKATPLYLTGTVDSQTATVITDAAASAWVASALIGQRVTCLGESTSMPTSATITANTTTTATHTRWESGAPLATSTYVIGNGPAASMAPDLTAYHTFAVKLEPDLSAIFSIDGNVVCRIDDAIATATTGLTPWLFAQARGGGTNEAIMYADYLLCMQSRRA